VNICIWKIGKSRWLDGSVLLALALASGCSRPSSVHANDSANPSSDSGKEKRVPFHPDAGAASDAGPGVARQQPSQNSSAANGLPFRMTSSPTLPVGTLLTVKLGVALSSAEVGANQIFSGVIEEPIMSEGNVLVPLGTSVEGRVESARSSNGRPHTGYVRLTLDSITIEGKQTPLHTASLFARGDLVRRADLSAIGDAGPKGAPGEIRLEKGHRLIFRLTAPAVPSDSEVGTSSETTLPSSE
jgi:hypothetical protein